MVKNAKLRFNERGFMHALRGLLTPIQSVIILHTSCRLPVCHQIASGVSISWLINNADEAMQRCLNSIVFLLRCAHMLQCIRLAILTVAFMFYVF